MARGSDIAFSETPHVYHIVCGPDSATLNYVTNSVNIAAGTCFAKVTTSTGVNVNIGCGSGKIIQTATAINKLVAASSNLIKFTFPKM